jgi:hypothetical protein
MGKGPEDERDWRNNETADDPVCSFFYARLLHPNIGVQHGENSGHYGIGEARVPRQIFAPVLEVAFCDW